MGVDFDMDCCAPVSDKECELVSRGNLEHKGERVGFSERKGSAVDPLLAPNGLSHLRNLGEACRWASLRELVDKPVSFEFYDKMSGFAYEHPQIIPRECCFDPKAVLETLEALQEAIEKYDPELPVYFYWIVHRPDGTSIEMGYVGQPLSVLWKGEPYRLKVGWNKCYLEAPDARLGLFQSFFGIGKYIDLRERVSEGLEMQAEELGGRVEILKRSFKETFSSYLSEMIEVCRTALRHGWLIFTHIW